MTGRPPPPARTVPARGRRGLRPSAPPPLHPRNDAGALSQVQHLAAAAVRARAFLGAEAGGAGGKA